MNRYSSSLDILKTLRKKGMMQPDGSLGRAFPRGGFSVDYLDSKTLEELNEIYDNWRKKEAEDRKNLRKNKRMFITPPAPFLPKMINEEDMVVVKKSSDADTNWNADKTEGMVYKKPPKIKMTNELDTQRKRNKQIVNENMLPARAYSTTTSDRKMRALARENSSSSTKWDENREELANALLYMNTAQESETEEDDIDVSSVASEGTLLDSDMDHGLDDNKTDEPIEPVPKRSRISRGALQGQDSLHYLPINKGGSTKRKDKKKRSRKKRSRKITRKNTRKRTKKITKKRTK